jgi:tetratricopeptide (TPR) repeat protein
MEFFDKIRLDELFYEADQQIKEQKYADAMQTLEAILAEAPKYGKAYNHLGWLYETKYRDFKKAEEFYIKCLEYEPEYTPVYLNLAVVLSAMGKYEELENLLNKALVIPGIDRATIYNEYAIMNELKTDYAKAIEHYKLAIRYSLNDNNIDTYKNSIQRCRNKAEILKDH